MGTYNILDGLIATMNNAADALIALMRHQGQANKVRTKATRTTYANVRGQTI